jgi:hypothetical protein
MKLARNLISKIFETGMGTCAEAENLAENKKDRIAVLSMGRCLANDPVECQSGPDPGHKAGGRICPNEHGPLKTKIRGPFFGPDA